MHGLCKGRLSSPRRLCKRLSWLRRLCIGLNRLHGLCKGRLSSLRRLCKRLGWLYRLCKRLNRLHGLCVRNRLRIIEILRVFRYRTDVSGRLGILFQHHIHTQIAVS